MKLSSALSVTATTFAGGVTGYLTTAFSSGIPAGFAWKATVISAVLAGIAALLHLYQDPSKGPATIGEQIDIQEFSRLTPEQKKAALDLFAKKNAILGGPLDFTSEYPVAIVDAPSADDPKAKPSSPTPRKGEAP